MSWPKECYKPVRLQRSRQKGARLRSPNGHENVCATRPGKWGNPIKRGVIAFIVGRGSVLINSNADAIEAYKINAVDVFAGAVFRKEVRAALKDKNLACWCKLCDKHRYSGKPFDEDCPDCQPCHVDTLIRIANT